MSGARRPFVMGIINVTPDSFSDGGRFLDATAALAQASRLIAEGADILDVGGESSRPGADVRVPESEEVARVVPAIEAIRAASAIPISIDTTKPAVARAAVRAGATMWNDISGLRGAPDSLDAVAELGVEVVIMHMLGEPATMQAAPRYRDVVADVTEFLLGRAEAAIAAGVARDRIWLDPGIGFGKSPEHNIALIRALPDLVGRGYPVLAGISRKSSIRLIARDRSEPDQRLGGSIAAALAFARAGVAAIRVHDVAETKQALAIAAAIGDA
jgi:dihydropteroate synthase